MNNQPLIIAKAVLGDTFYFNSRETFERWLDSEFADYCWKSTGDEYRVYCTTATMEAKGSPQCTFLIKEDVLIAA